LSLHDPVKALESGAGDHGPPFEDAWKGWRIAAPETVVVAIIIADSPEMLLKLVLLPKPLGPNTAVVEITIADLRAELDPAHVIWSVKTLKLLACGEPRYTDYDMFVQSSHHCLSPECSLTVNATYRVPVRKSVLAQLVTYEHDSLGAHLATSFGCGINQIKSGYALLKGTQNLRRNRIRFSKLRTASGQLEQESQR
jgi:hypothetical protein